MNLWAPERSNGMNFVASLSAFALGFGVGGAGGIVLGFVWYERKCRLLSDYSGERAAAIRSELDDVFGRGTVSRRKYPSYTPAEPL
jgi:hypothetical protein